MVELDEDTRTVMTEDVRTVDAACSAHEAAGVLLDEEIGSVVVEAEPRGILTKTDLVAGLREDIDPESTPVEELMTPRPTTVEVDEPLSAVVATMADATVKRVPVTDNSEVVGIITTSDLVAAAAPEDDNRGSTLASVFAATVASTATQIYECVRCGARQTVDDNPGACPKCEGRMRNISVTQE